MIVGGARNVCGVARSDGVRARNDCGSDGGWG